MEAARRLYDARNRGDVEGVIAECHQQVEWHPHLSSLGGQPIRGHDGVRRYLNSLAGEWTEFRHEPEEFAGDSPELAAARRRHPSHPDFVPSQPTAPITDHERTVACLAVC